MRVKLLLLLTLFEWRIACSFYWKNHLNGCQILGRFAFLKTEFQLNFGFLHISSDFFMVLYVFNFFVAFFTLVKNATKSYIISFRCRILKSRFRLKINICPSLDNIWLTLVVYMLVRFSMATAEELQRHS